MSKKNIFTLIIFGISFLGSYGVADALTCSGPFTYDPWTDGGRNNYANGCISQPNGCGNCWCPDDPEPPAPTNGSCGARNNSYDAYTNDWPSDTALCSAGAPSPENVSFPSQGETVSWTCHGFNGGSDASCQASRGSAPSPVNGSCGARHAAYAATDSDWETDTSFCLAGSPSPSEPVFPSAGGTTSWTCSGNDGGSAATCQATRESLSPNDGTCGGRSRTYYAVDTGWSNGTEFCSAGTVSPSDPIFPAIGGTSTWTCNGSNGGSNVVCQARRNDEDEGDEDCDGKIGNYVWLDANGDGKQDQNEKGLQGIRVKLTFGDTTYRTTTDHKGHYSFKNLCSGNYTVTVKDEDVSKYKQTYDPDGKKNNKADVRLKNDRDSDMNTDFGYRGKSIAPATGSGNIALYSSMLITFLIFIAYRKIRFGRIA